MSNLSAVRADIRRLNREMYVAQLRQSARLLFDLPGFGTDRLERMAASVVLGAVFFAAALVGGKLAGLSLGLAFAFAGGVLMVVVATSAMFVFGPRDAELAAAVEDGEQRLAELQEEEADLTDADADDDEDDEDDDEDERDDRRGRRGRRRSARRRAATCPYCREPIRAGR